MNPAIERAMQITGWISDAEAEFLFGIFAKPDVKAALEIGSYLGRSTYVIASALAGRGVLYALDWHNGSTDHQPGGRAHQADTIVGGKVDTWPGFKDNVKSLNNVVGLRLSSREYFDRVYMPGGVDAVFIDGEHLLADTVIDLTIAASLNPKTIVVHDYRNPNYPDVEAACNALGYKPQRIVGTAAQISRG